MKIAFVTNICTHYVVRLFELLAGMRDTVFYFTGGYETYWEKKNKIHLGNFKSRILKGFLLAPRLKISPGLFGLFFKKVDIFIKSLDDRFALILVFLAAKIRKKPFILWTGLWHHPQTWVHQRTFWMTQQIYHHSDGIVVYGQHVKKYLEDLGVDSEKIFIAPHSVNNERYNICVSMEEKQELRKCLDIGDRKITLYVGRLEQCKGLDDLIEAIQGMNTTQVHLLFIGDGSLREQFEQKCRRYAISHKFLNHVPNEELYRYYAMADIFVLPSVTTRDFKEPWGLVINEAMNQGCPVITTDAVGAAAGGLVEDGKNGFIVPERDSLALKKAMETLLKDDDLRRRMGREARDKIERWGGPEQTVLGFIEAIEFVRGKRARKDI